MSEIKYIPKHWEWVKLEEIAKWGSGGTPTSTNPEYYEGNIPWLIIGDLNDGIISESLKKITKDGLDNSSAKMVQPGSVLIAMYGSIGKLGINKIPVATNQAIAFTEKLNDNINNKYLFHYLFHIRSKLHSLGKGGTQKNISQTVLKKVDFPLPPLPEQQAIVAKIEELLSELDNGKQQLQTALQQSKVYRQSLLNLIVTGKNCKAIETVIEKLDQGWSPRCLNENSKDELEWAVIKTSAVQYGHFVSVENKILPTELKPREQHELKVGDILITRAGPRVRVGVCCLVRKTRPRLINCDKVYRIKVNTEVVSPEYFELILNTPFYQREIEKMKSGISDSGLNLTQTKFLKIEIPIPTLEEQQLIVDELESKLTICDKVEETIKLSLQQAETLRQSILKQAFEGKLV